VLCIARVFAGAPHGREAVDAAVMQNLDAPHLKDGELNLNPYCGRSFSTTRLVFFPLHALTSIPC
jgi:hypothetical protein